MHRSFRILGASALVCSFVGLVPLLPSSLWAADPVSAEYVAGELLVGFREGAGLLRREAVLERLGAVVERAEPALGYHLVRVPAGSVESALERLAGDPDVVWAEPNWTVEAVALPTCPQDPFLTDLPDSLNQWGVFATNLFSMWRHGGGGDPAVVIAIVDSGVDDFGAPHADLAANVMNGAGQGRDFVDGDFVPTDGGASAGHGTAVGGVAAAAANSVGTAGVAYCSRLMFVRVLDCAGASCTGSADAVAQGIRWAADNGADVINLSLAHPAYSQAMRNAVLYAMGLDCIVVAAAGNDGTGALPYPANYPELITVGATDPSGDVWSDSNWGANLDVVAPGADVWTPYPGGYDKNSGTSLAAPFVSGLAALLTARHPAITQLEAEAWLKNHALPTPSPARDGAGRIQFNPLSDWGDHLFHPPTFHGLSLWEWLGPDVTPEASDVDPNDTDGVPNVDPFDSNAADLADDGLYYEDPASIPMGSTRWHPAKTFDVTLSTSDHTGIRYGATADSMIHLDQWIDWDSDGMFGMSPDPEHTIVDHKENPKGWPADQIVYSQVIPVHPEHILGNPLAVRTRLSYGTSNDPATPSPYGEVEDDKFVNFVEDFDTVFYTNGAPPGPYMDMGTWFPVPDPDPLFSNHGTWEMARAAHPKPFEECTGFVESIEIMKAPPMDWSEYTKAKVAFVYSHRSFQCGPDDIEECRVALLLGPTEVDSKKIPIGDGLLEWDVSGWTSEPMVQLAWILETDNQGHLIIDDIVIVAYDDEKPTAITNLGVARTAGSRDITLTWTSPDDNVAPTLETIPSAYQIRYAPNPILNEADFHHATPVYPWDTSTSALPIPPAAGAGQSMTFEAPSAYQSYFFAVRTGDEVSRFSALSNVPSIANAPTLAVAVTAPAGTTQVAPGDTAYVSYSVQNTGNVTEIFGLTATGIIEGWDAVVVESGVARGGSVSLQLNGGETQFVTAGAVGAGGNGTIEALSLVAASTTDPIKTSSASAVLRIDAATDAPAVATPTALALQAAGPNPFRSRTAFKLSVPTSRHAQVALYDVAGRRVRTLLDGTAETGTHSLEWDGTGEDGRAAPSGIYFLKVTTEGLSETRRVIRMR